MSETKATLETLQLSPEMLSLLGPWLSEIDLVHQRDLKTHLGDKPMILVNECVDIIQILEHFRNPKIQNFVQLGKPNTLSAIMNSCMLISRPKEFMKHPLTNFLTGYKNTKSGANKTRTIELNLKTTQDKAVVLNNLDTFLASAPNASSIHASALLLADEMITNAFYNAPVDSSGKPMHANKDRDTKLVLAPKNIKFSVAHDENRFVLGCEDPFGSLVRETLINKLLYALTTETINTKHQSVGAGLGCKLMLQKSASFYVVVQREQKTQFVCVMELGKMKTEVENKIQNLHIVEWG